ncbi:MAG: hypothetical protein ACM3PY_01185 [Omnitrophica WOR_2 bacterium]
MNDPITGPNLENEKMSKIHEGMTVYDRNHHPIGKVEDVFLGELSSEESDEGKGPATSADSRGQNTAAGVNPITEVVERAFDPDYPGEPDKAVENRMSWEGYIRIDTGLLSKDRYALAEQVHDVTAEGVFLNATKEELPDRSDVRGLR